MLISLPLAFNLPTALAPSAVSVVIVAEVGPPPGRSVEYTCQPLSILAKNIISTSVGEICFCCTLKCTGFCICADAEKPNTTHKIANNTNLIFVILLYKFIINYIKIAKVKGMKR